MERNIKIYYLRFSKLLRRQSLLTIFSLAAAVFSSSVSIVAILKIPSTFHHNSITNIEIFPMPDVSLPGGACQTQNLGKCKAGPTSKTTIKGKTSVGTNKYETFSRLFGQ